MASNTTRSKYWMLTINNPVASDLSKIETLIDGETIQYCKVAREIGEQGTTHFQIYAVFATAVSFAGVKKMFPVAHIEQRFGSHTQAKDYIGNLEKSGSVEWVREYGNDDGIPDGQGSRSDVSKQDEILKQIQLDIFNGAGLSLLWSNPEYFPVMVKHFRGINEFISQLGSSSRLRMMKPVGGRSGRVSLYSVGDEG